MNTTELKTSLLIEIYKNRINALENKLNSDTLHTEVKYHNKELNNSLKKDFDEFTSMLQSVVDDFYVDKYIVDSFIPLYLDDLTHCKKHNLSLLNSMKKLLNYVCD